MTTPMDLSVVRERLTAARGKQYWRSLEELAGEDGFAEMLEREFPRLASEWTNALSRRRFLGLMGASLALAGLSGCNLRPQQQIMPYVRQPEDLVLGKPLFYATAMSSGGYATGLLIESHEGRPTKVEGNPDHPISRGATDSLMQASMLTMYDPDRSQTISFRGRIRNWSDAVEAVRRRLAGDDGKGTGKGVFVLTEAVGSPTLAAQLEALVKKYPDARWIQYEPTAADAALAGAKQAFGQPVNTFYRLEKAEVIVALDADFLGSGPASLANIREFAAGRRLTGGSKTMNRLYAVECTPTITGASADNRLPLRASEVYGFTQALPAKPGVAGAKAPTLGKEESLWVEVVAKDLQSKGAGRTAVIPGALQPAAVHALVHAINAKLGNLGVTAIVTDPVLARPADSLAGIKELTEALKTDQAKTLLIIDSNPVYTAPVDLGFGALLAEKAEKSDTLFLHLGLYEDETAKFCHWHIPLAHYLEAWGDGRAVDGTASIVQPLIAPLYSGKSALELISALTTDEELTAYELVRETWRAHWKKTGSSGEFDKYWQRALHNGVIPETTYAHKSLPVTLDVASLPAVKEPTKDVELVLAPDPVLHDGRFANNGWLQELPKPMTKLTWDNALMMSPALAVKLGVGTQIGATGGEHGRTLADVVKITVGGRSLEVPIWIAPGHAEDAVTLHLGYGRTRGGHVGGSEANPVGFNANLLRTTETLTLITGVKIEKVGRKYDLACVQGHHNIKEEKNILKERGIIRSATLEDYKKDVNFAHRGEEGEYSPDEKAEKEASSLKKELPTIYPQFVYNQHKWAMAIDMTTCVGCSACVVACQAENNIPVVGKAEVMNGREMHWLRIDRYWEAEADATDPTYNPNVFFQPLPCQHCENAPCEQVCPVNATVHSEEGTNDMVYNRCVGTRYCSNNCPYKVRRFNFLLYTKDVYSTPSLKLLQNPDVTVRTRGVMEKCTYCIQRINYARIEAEKEATREREQELKAKSGAPLIGADLLLDNSGRKRLDPARPNVAVIHDGEIVTACQAACPAQAIVFGDLNDPKSRVSKLQDDPLNYGLLSEDLNTRPRTTYLAAVRNPNPELKSHS